MVCMSREDNSEAAGYTLRVASVLVRRATIADLARINDIYNEYVRTSTSTYQEEPETMDGRRTWFDRHGLEYPVTVADIDGAVVGWAALSRFHPRSAYRYTVEDAVYVDPAWQRRGVGTALLRDLISRARLIGYQTIIATVDAQQDASLALHVSLGFETSGRLRQVGYKFGRWLDVIYLQKSL